MYMNEQGPEVRSRHEEVPEVTLEKEKKLPIEVIEEIDQFYFCTVF